MSSSEPETIFLSDYQPYAFTLESLHLHFDLHEDHTLVKSLLVCKRNSLVQGGNTLFLNGEEMELEGLFLNGKVVEQGAFQVDSASLTLLNVPNAFTLETVVRIKPQENKALSGLYRSRKNFCTQCEAEGFRRITYFPDRPDVMTRFTTTISADKTKYPMLLSNGNLIETKELANNRHWVHWEDPSLKPSYLFALVAGDFDLLEEEFITCSGAKVALRLYLEKGFKDQGSYALEALKKAMRWDEQTFGREYDLSVYMIVAVSDFNMGAMENKGLNIFNTKYILAKPETATDQDYTAIEAVIGHEYFHNWTGNRITCRDWFQLTLKEGLTVYRDQRFTEDMTSKGVARIDVSNVVRNLQFLEDAGPTAHPIRPESYIEINNFYTNTVYRKGAEVIRMIHTLIGEENFRKGMDLYFERHDGQAVTTEDFVKAMEDASNKDLTQFKRWYNQAGTPVLSIHSEYDEELKTYTLLVEQSCPATPGQKEKKPFHLPLSLGLISSHCVDMPTQRKEEPEAISGERILEITQPKEKFFFVHVDEKPVPSFLRGFSAPVRIKYTYSDAELLWLLQCDSDAFSRYEAGQQIMKRWIVKRVTEDVDIAGLIKAYQAILESPLQDKQYLARLLSLPSFNYLLQDSTVKEIDALHTAREFMKFSLACALEPLWLAIYRNNHLECTSPGIGERALKNLALHFLTSSKKACYFQLAFDQFRSSQTMSDTLGALLALNDHACVEREKALSEFYEKWQDQPLIVNKWLLLQSSSLLPTTLNTVQKSLDHPAFDRMNPNNVYALLGGFTSNVLRFHEKSGKGYALLTDEILKIDPVNPQVAARMLHPLTRWQQYDNDRAELMKTELKRLLATPSLSKDVYELSKKSLS